MGLRRSDWLPAYDSETLRAIVDETDECAEKYMKEGERLGDLDTSEQRPEKAKYLKACVERNGRYLYSYHMHRLAKVRQMRWETGSVIGAEITPGTLSAAEREYFSKYSEILVSTCRDHLPLIVVNH